MQSAKGITGVCSCAGSDVMRAPLPLIRDGTRRDAEDGFTAFLDP